MWNLMHQQLPVHCVCTFGSIMAEKPDYKTLEQWCFQQCFFPRDDLSWNTIDLKHDLYHSISKKKNAV